MEIIKAISLIYENNIYHSKICGSGAQSKLCENSASLNITIAAV